VPPPRAHGRRVGGVRRGRLQCRSDGAARSGTRAVGGCHERRARVACRPGRGNGVRLARSRLRRAAAGKRADCDRRRRSARPRCALPGPLSGASQTFPAAGSGAKKKAARRRLLSRPRGLRPKSSSRSRRSSSRSGS
jgi:hypothetical protein